MHETIDTGIGKTVARASEKTIRAFIDLMMLQCPHTTADIKASGDIKTDTALANLIYTVEYLPSTLALLADQKALIKKGFLVDADIRQLSLRNMTEHCTKPMLDELAIAVKAHEDNLVAILVEPAPKTDIEKPSAPERETAIVNDEMLGRIEIDVKTAEIVRMVSDNDAMGDILVDDSHAVVVTLDAETAKQSTVWGSW